MEEGRAKSLLIRTEAEGAEIGYIRLPKFYFEADGKPGCAADIATEVDKLVKEGCTGHHTRPSKQWRWITFRSRRHDRTFY